GLEGEGHSSRPESPDGRSTGRSQNGIGGSACEPPLLPHSGGGCGRSPCGRDADGAPAPARGLGTLDPPPDLPEPPDLPDPPEPPEPPPVRPRPEDPDERPPAPPNQPPPPPAPLPDPLPPDPPPEPPPETPPPDPPRPVHEVGRGLPVPEPAPAVLRPPPALAPAMPPATPPPDPPEPAPPAPAPPPAVTPSGRWSPDARDGRFSGGAPRRERPCCAAPAPAPRGLAARTGASSGDGPSPAPACRRSAAATAPGGTSPCAPWGTASEVASRLAQRARPAAPGATDDATARVLRRASETDRLSCVSLFSRAPTAP